MRLSRYADAPSADRARDFGPSEGMIMTNREMVKDPRVGGPKLPEPNLPQRVLVPSPEGDPDLFTTDDPIDSPQPNPVINPARRQGFWETDECNALDHSPVGRNEFA